MPGLEFKLLSLVAAAGPNGILQPDLTKLSGQDKRSVPKRTDALENKGYITKEKCLGGGIQTSILRFKKYVEATQPSSEAQDEQGAVSVHMRVREAEDPEFKMIRYDIWFDKLVDTLKNSHNNLMAWEDMRTEMVSFFKAIGGPTIDKPRASSTTGG